MSSESRNKDDIPHMFIGSMYGIFTYIWLIFMVNVGAYTSPMDPMGTCTLLKNRECPNFPQLSFTDKGSCMRVANHTSKSRHKFVLPPTSRDVSATV